MPATAETRTLCPYCGVGCGLLARTRDGRLEEVAGDPLHPVNRGRTCRKPLELGAAVHAADRAVEPLLRADRDVALRAAGWDEALDHLAARLHAIRDEHGPDSIAFYISGQLLTEDYYAVNKLAKGFLRTNNVDSNSRLCMSCAVAGYTGAFGSDGPPPSYADLAHADCFLLLGTNTAACHPIVWSRIRDRQAEGAFVICADPRPTPTARARGPPSAGAPRDRPGAAQRDAARDRPRRSRRGGVRRPPHQRLGRDAGRRARVGARAGGRGVRGERRRDRGSGRRVSPRPRPR